MGPVCYVGKGRSNISAARPPNAHISLLDGSLPAVPLKVLGKTPLVPLTPVFEVPDALVGLGLSSVVLLVAAVLPGVKVIGDAVGKGSTVEFTDRDERVCVAAIDVSRALQDVDQLEIWVYSKPWEVHSLV